MNKVLTAEQIVEENFKGLDELIEDKDLLLWYKDLIVTCMEAYKNQSSVSEESNVSSQEPDAEQMKTDKGVVLAHYYQVEPDSHYWTSLEMLLNYLKQVEIFTGYRSYLIKGIENTIKNGFRLINTPQTTQEPDATASKEIGEPLVQNKSNQ